MPIEFNEWLLPDEDRQLFYPFGLKCYANEQKCVVLVWNHDTLCSLIFKNMENMTKPTKIYRHLIGCPIDTITSGSSEMIINTTTGNVWNFVKQSLIQPIKYLKDIKCICVAQNKFFMIRVTNENNGKISLLIHPTDFSASVIPETDIKSYDLSIETFYCKSNWSNSLVKIMELQSPKEYPEFFKFLTKSKNDAAVELKYQLFISIDNVFMAFIMDDDDSDDYHMNHIQLYSSAIYQFWQSKDKLAIYILLASGTIEIIYWCTNVCGPKLCQLHFGDEITVYDTFDDWFIYSNGYEIIAAHLSYSPIDKTYKCNRHVWNIFGVCGLSYNIVADSIICITENCTFFAISLKSEKLTDAKLDDDAGIKVDKHFLANADSMIKTNLFQLNEMYQNAIKVDLQLNRQFQMIANYKNRKNVQISIDANVSFHRSMPKNVSAINLTSNSDTYFAYIEIEKIENEIVLSNQCWNLMISIQNASQTECKIVKLFAESLLMPINICLALPEKQFFILPKIKINLITAICIEAEYLNIKIPIKLNDYSINDLIEMHTTEPKMYPNKNDKIYLINSIINSMSDKKKCEKDWSILSYKITLPNEITLQQFLAIFPNHHHHRSDIDIATVTNSIYVTIFRSIVKIEFEKDFCNRILELKCNDPGAMHCIKDFICCELMKKFKDADCDVDLDALNSKVIDSSIKMRHFNLDRDNPSIAIKEFQLHIDKIRAMMNTQL